MPFDLPSELSRFVSGARMYDSSCSSQARVYFLDKDGGYYLKTAPVGALQKEAQMTTYFHRIGLGAEVLHYGTEELDMLLTAKLRGEDGVHPDHLAHPERLCDTVAKALRQLHETDFADCPISDRTADYIRGVEQGYREGRFDRSLLGDRCPFSSAEEAKRIFDGGKKALMRDTLLHGDYCLPNILLADWKPSGFIDLDGSGVGDRHIDLFWALWSLRYNLKTDAYRNRFLDAYGRDKVDEDLLLTVAAAEVFG